MKRNAKVRNIKNTWNGRKSFHSMANTSGKQNYGELCFLHICAYNSQFITFYIFWWSQQGVKDFLITAIMRNKTNTKHHCGLIIIIIDSPKTIMSISIVPVGLYIYCPLTKNSCRHQWFLSTKLWYWLSQQLKAWISHLLEQGLDDSVIGLVLPLDVLRLV